VVLVLGERESVRHTLKTACLQIQKKKQFSPQAVGFIWHNCFKVPVVQNAICGKPFSSGYVHQIYCEAFKFLNHNVLNDFITQAHNSNSHSKILSCCGQCQPLQSIKYHQVIDSNYFEFSYLTGKSLNSAFVNQH
jgi:hypothetical protein